MILLGDWREHILRLDGIDCVMSDPPYNTTGCAWDGKFDPREFWSILEPRLSPRCSVVLTAQMRLAVDLIAHSPLQFRHDLVWEKPNGTGQVRYSPNRCHELILVFGRGKPVYEPQMTEGKPYNWSATRSKGEAVGYSGSGEIRNGGTRHPRSVLRIAQQRGLHPTQKPVELFEFLIRSYSLPVWQIVDPFCGSGTTGVAARNTGRTWWLCEQNPLYYDMARSRLDEKSE